MQALPDKQQEQIRSLLTKFYGTPSDPVLMVLADVPSSSGREMSKDEKAGDEFDFNLTAKLDPDHLKLGAEVFQQRCVACHGVTGDGKGPAAEYLNPKPRDYREGIFKFTSTGRNRPRKADLIRTIKYGALGTSMPSFRWLSQDELSAVADYVILLAQRGETESKLVVLAKDDELQFAAEDAQSVYESWKEAPTHLVQPATPPPPLTEEAIERGRQAFLVTGCVKCHGTSGQGFTSHEMKDDWGHPTHAANLTSGMFHGGRRDIDIYRRIYAGINGTPMPASGDIFTGQGDKNEEEANKEKDLLWDLTYYVIALSQGREFPEVTMQEARQMEVEHRQNKQPTPPMPEVPMPEPMPDVPIPEPNPRRVTPRPPTVDNAAAAEATVDS